MTQTIQRADAFEALSGLEDSSADAAVVDYPWNLEGSDRPGPPCYDRDDDWEMQDNAAIVGVLEDVARILVDGGWVFIFADDDVLPEFRIATEDALEYRKTLIWDTKRIGTGHYFRSRHGYVIAATNGDTDRYVTDVPTVIEAAAPQREPGENTEYYPTEKPARLYHQLLEPVVDVDDRIIEPFCGTAPALEVAKSLGCRYWGCDVSEDALCRARDRGSQSCLGGIA